MGQEVGQETGQEVDQETGQEVDQETGQEVNQKMKQEVVQRKDHKLEHEVMDGVIEDIYQNDDLEVKTLLKTKIENEKSDFEGEIQEAHFAGKSEVFSGDEYKYQQKYTFNKTTYLPTLELSQTDIKSETQFVCKCQKGFETAMAFDFHVQHIHLKSTIMCSSCGMDIIKKDKSRHNDKYHRSSKKCQYSECDFETISRGGIRVHVNDVHLKIEKTKDFVCDDCGKGFYKMTLLRTHIIVDHLGERRHKCETCGKAFGRKKNLDKHKDVHSATNKYICGTCGRGFRNDGALWNHRQLHKRGQKLLRGEPKHVETREGEVVLLRCGGCAEKVVVTKKEMEGHMKARHPAGKHFWCDQCNYTFVTGEELNSHNRKYHGSQGAKKRKY